MGSKTREVERLKHSLLALAEVHMANARGLRLQADHEVELAEAILKCVKGEVDQIAYTATVRERA
jgi:hypothetical protein